MPVLFSFLCFCAANLWDYLNLMMMITGLICGQVVSGIALPAGLDKLYTGSKDETVRAWDTNSGQVVLNFVTLSFIVGVLI